MRPGTHVRRRVRFMRSALFFNSLRLLMPVGNYVQFVFFLAEIGMKQINKNYQQQNAGAPYCFAFQICAQEGRYNPPRYKGQQHKNVHIQPFFCR